MTASRVDEQQSSERRQVAVAVENVHASFDGPGASVKTVLKSMSLVLNAGEFTAFVGRSGCGKTTLLNMVAGVVAPTAGEVSVLGRSPREARGELGFMLARDALMPWRTALRNVEYGLEIRGMAKKERRAIAMEWLAKVGLESAAELWPWQLSQGMRQRVALARTWALDPSILLMDEPFAALDAHTRVAVQNEFINLWQGAQRKTVLFVTHDIGEAIALADRIILLGEGRILRDLTVDIPRPRDLAAVSETPQYAALHAELRRLLD